MKNKTKSFFYIGLIILASVLIPLLFFFFFFQASRYSSLYKDIVRLEKKQEQLVEQNKKLISDISLVGNSSEIERKASEELNMHKAEKEDIIRIEMSSSD